MHSAMIPVVSSNIDGYYYFTDRELLLITFKSSGDTYAYEGVPKEVVANFASASSKGKFFGTFIRDEYVTTKLDEMAVGNLLSGLNATKTPSPRKAPSVVFPQLLQKYPMLAVVF